MSRYHKRNDMNATTLDTQDTLPAPADETLANEPAPLVTATYDAGDNKIRLRPTSDRRLDPETYARVKKAGYAWAPNQRIFVAPMWTPEREDLALELAGFIDEEESTLEERAAARAERFGGYQERRADDAERTHAYVEKITGDRPPGQPIAAGNWRAAKRAQKEAEKIDRGMKRAVQLWETSEYWARRAEGAIKHARYKELPRVRMGRIKGLEADERRELKNKSHAEALLKLWNHPDLTREQAIKICNFHDHCSRSDERPGCSLWSCLSAEPGSHSEEYNGGRMELAEAVARAVLVNTRALERAERWLVHLGHRLTFERAMLAASGHVMPGKATRRKLPPLVNRPAATDKPEDARVSLTTAQWERIYKEARGTRVIDGERVRCVNRNWLKDLGVEVPALPPRDPHDTRMGDRHLAFIFLSDAKVTPAKIAAATDVSPGEATTDVGPGEPDDDEGDEEGTEVES